MNILKIAKVMQEDFVLQLIINIFDKHISLNVTVSDYVDSNFEVRILKAFNARHYLYHNGSLSKNPDIKTPQVLGFR